MATDEYLTVAEIAEQLKLNQQTVRNFIDRGEVRAMQVGPRRVRIRRSDLDLLLRIDSEERLLTEVPVEQEPPADDLWDRVGAALVAGLQALVMSSANADGMSWRRPLARIVQ